MDRLLFLLTLKPIIYGLIGVIISGVSFPIAGVIIMRNGLIPMRYMLMHSVILGGVLAIALHVPFLASVIPLSISLVLLMMRLNSSGHALSTSSTAMMVCTMGFASLLGHIFDIPAKDTLELLWGSPFALTALDLLVVMVLGVLIIIYICFFFKSISMVFFDSEIACSLGVNVKLHNTVMVLFTALIISVAMKMLGALLIDALVVLPVIGASKNSVSLKQLFIKSSLTGLCLSVAGYFIALIFNLPVSGVLAVLATVVFVINQLISNQKSKKSL